MFWFDFAMVRAVHLVWGIGYCGFMCLWCLWVVFVIIGLGFD